jgi:Uma2 family endonuclease
LKEAAMTVTTPPAVLDEEPLFEIVNGVRVEVPRMGAFACLLANVLAKLLNDFAEPARLGFAVIEILFRLSPGGPSRRPDVAFVGLENWPDDYGVDPAEWEQVPLIAIEIVSPTNTAAELAEKRADYFAAGVRHVWVVYPRQQQVEVYDSATGSRVLRGDDVLEAGGVLPGFRLRISDLFAKATVTGSNGS